MHCLCTARATRRSFSRVDVSVAVKELEVVEAENMSRAQYTRVRFSIRPGCGTR
jgi:hypothetical protein